MTVTISEKVRYRAYCKTEKRYCGQWRDDLESAREDSRAHVREPDHEDHETTVIMEQKSMADVG